MSNELPQSKLDEIKAEALENCPFMDGFTTKGISHEIYTGQKYIRLGYEQGATAEAIKNQSIEKEMDELKAWRLEAEKTIIGITEAFTLAIAERDRYKNLLEGLEIKIVEHTIDKNSNELPDDKIPFAAIGKLALAAIDEYCENNKYQSMTETQQLQDILKEIKSGSITGSLTRPDVNVLATQALSVLASKPDENPLTKSLVKEWDNKSDEHWNNFANTQPSTNTEPEIKWVRASERLPKNEKQWYMFRQAGNTISAKLIVPSHHRYPVDDIPRYMQLPLNEIEWLEETPPIDRDGGGELE